MDPDLARESKLIRHQPNEVGPGISRSESATLVKKMNKIRIKVSESSFLSVKIQIRVLSGSRTVTLVILTKNEVNSREQPELQLSIQKDISITVKLNVSITKSNGYL